MGTIRLSDVYIGQVCNGICLGLCDHARRVGKGPFSTLGFFFPFSSAFISLGKSIALGYFDAFFTLDGNESQTSIHYEPA